MRNKFKHILLVFAAILMFFSGELFSQSPYAFNYQAILRNPDGSLKASQGVILKFEILDVQDQVKYTETHSAVSNEYGLVNAQIGRGSTVDDLSAVQWGESAFFLKVYVDDVAMGSSQLLSVPYALYALNAKTPGPEGPVGPQGPAGPAHCAASALWPVGREVGEWRGVGHGSGIQRVGIQSCGFGRLGIATRPRGPALVLCGCLAGARRADRFAPERRRGIRPARYGRCVEASHGWRLGVTVRLSFEVTG